MGTENWNGKSEMGGAAMLSCLHITGVFTSYHADLLDSKKGGTIPMLNWDFEGQK